MAESSYITGKRLKAEHKQGKHRGMANEYGSQSLSHGSCELCRSLLNKGLVLRIED